jgi:hypothetical protein
MAFGWTGRNSGGSEHVDRGMIAEVRGYWEALREGEQLPRRDRIDPRGIAGALEHSFLVERLAPGVARFRISGMVFNDLMGMDVRGMPLSCLFLGEARNRLQLDLERVFRTPAIVTLDLVAERSLVRSDLRGRIQMMPMLGQDDETVLAIGCLELTGEIGRAPRRFSITRSQVEAVTPTRSVGSRPVPQPETELQAAAPRPPRATPGVPHLRLVKT